MQHRPSESDPLAGTAYRSVSLLGRGGMGEVVVAEHVPSGRRYAVKLLLHEAAANPRAMDRMRLEFEAVRAFRHPNVVLVHELGRTVARGDAPSLVYLVMELLAGRSLREEVVARGALSAREVLEVGAQLFDGLAAAHAAGLVHRDIKPDNLFLCEGPAPRTLKILDWGITKIVDPRADGPAPLEIPTAANVVVGTPRWASPEALADGSQVDVRSDLYSAGLVLWSLASGQMAWPEADTLEDIVRAQLLERLPRLAKAAGDEHAAIDAIVARLTQKKREDRPASAAEVAASLRQELSARYGGQLVLLTTEALPVERQRAAAPRPGLASEPVTVASLASEPMTTRAPMAGRPVKGTLVMEPPRPQVPRTLVEPSVAPTEGFAVPTAAAPPTRHDAPPFSPPPRVPAVAPAPQAPAAPALAPARSLLAHALLGSLLAVVAVGLAVYFVRSFVHPP